jgi:iron-sulfur cluster repair protein YtfE (RIC family)
MAEVCKCVTNNRGDLTDNIDELVGMVSVMTTRLNKLREQNTRSTRNYRAKNRDKINAISKKYYDTHKLDPVWLADKREKQRVYQQHRRYLKSLEKEENSSPVVVDRKCPSM